MGRYKAVKCTRRQHCYPARTRHDSRELARPHSLRFEDAVTDYSDLKPVARLAVDLDGLTPLSGAHSVVLLTIALWLLPLPYIPSAL